MSFVMNFVLIAIIFIGFVKPGLSKSKRVGFQMVSNLNLRLVPHRGDPIWFIHSRFARDVFLRALLTSDLIFGCWLYLVFSGHFLVVDV